jgi:hypothetical protein
MITNVAVESWGQLIFIDIKNWDYCKGYSQHTSASH